MISFDRAMALAAILIACGSVGLALGRGGIETGTMSVSDRGPSSPDNLVFDHVWHSQVDHNDAAPINCGEASADAVSQCFVEIGVPITERLRGATHAILGVKAKAWIPSGPSSETMNYGLIYASFMFESGATNNHFIHVEEWGGKDDYQEERRRVTFSTVIAPIIDGKILIRVGKQIMGRAEIEIAGYIEGYLYQPTA